MAAERRKRVDAVSNAAPKFCATAFSTVASSIHPPSAALVMMDHCDATDLTRLPNTHLPCLTCSSLADFGNLIETDTSSNAKSRCLIQPRQVVNGPRQDLERIGCFELLIDCVN